MAVSPMAIAAEERVRCEPAAAGRPAVRVAGGEPSGAQRTLEREKCEVDPKDASWPMHPCENTAIKV